LETTYELTWAKCPEALRNAVVERTLGHSWRGANSQLTATSARATWTRVEEAANIRDVRAVGQELRLADRAHPTGICRPLGRQRSACKYYSRVERLLGTLEPSERSVSGDQPFSHEGRETQEDAEGNDAVDVETDADEAGWSQTESIAKTCVFRCRLGSGTRRIDTATWNAESENARRFLVVRGQIVTPPNSSWTQTALGVKGRRGGPAIVSADVSGTTPTDGGLCVQNRERGE